MKLLFIVKNNLWFFSDSGVRNLSLNKTQVVEIAFMLYPPVGLKLITAAAPRSTWVKPIVDGEDSYMYLGKHFLMGSFCRSVTNSILQLSFIIIHLLFTFVNGNGAFDTVYSGVPHHQPLD